MWSGKIVLGEDPRGTGYLSSIAWCCSKGYYSRTVFCVGKRNNCEGEKCCLCDISGIWDFLTLHTSHLTFPSDQQNISSFPEIFCNLTHTAASLFAWQDTIQAEPREHFKYYNGKKETSCKNIISILIKESGLETLEMRKISTKICWPPGGTGKAGMSLRTWPLIPRGRDC